MNHDACVSQIDVICRTVV